MSRFVVPNPVRVGMVPDPVSWPWSSYNATLGVERLPKWFTVDALLGKLGQQRQWQDGAIAVLSRKTSAKKACGAKPIASAS